MTIALLKSQFYVPIIKIVGYICNINRCHLEKAKVIKILDWSLYVSQKEARSFLGVMVYYQVLIEDFTIIAALIYKLLQKKAFFT